MEDSRIARQVAEWNPQGKWRRGRPVNIWKDGTGNNMQRKSLKDEECFGREFWRKKIMSLGLRKLCTHRKIPIYIKRYSPSITGTSKQTLPLDVPDKTLK
jgi:hypothetical protein